MRTARIKRRSSCQPVQRKAGCGRAERQPDHPAARRRRRRRRRAAHCPISPACTSPFGMALVGDTLYVANADALVAYPLRSGARPASRAAPRQITALPAQRNHHWTKSLAAGPDGRCSMSASAPTRNVAEHGMDEEERARRDLARSTRATGSHRLYATGPAATRSAIEFRPGIERALRVGQRARRARQRPRPRLSDPRAARAPSTAGPGPITGSHVDTRVEPPPAGHGRAARSCPIMRSAPMSRRSASPSARASGSGPRFANGAFVGLHGSWNRAPAQRLQGRLRPVRRRPPGGPADRRAHRLPRRAEPAGDGPPGRRRRSRRDGALLVADDVGNTRLAGERGALGRTFPRALPTGAWPSQHIRLEQSPAAVATITLNRPDSLNALNARDARRASRGGREPARLGRPLPAAHRRGPRLFERRGPRLAAAACPTMSARRWRRISIR